MIKSALKLRQKLFWSMLKLMKINEEFPFLPAVKFSIWQVKCGIHWKNSDVKSNQCFSRKVLLMYNFSLFFESYDPKIGNWNILNFVWGYISGQLVISILCLLNALLWHGGKHFSFFFFVLPVLFLKLTTIWITFIANLL
jgi:hypothetical protein